MLAWIILLCCPLVWESDVLFETPPEYSGGNVLLRTEYTVWTRM